jgi:hypothetical protein
MRRFLLALALMVLAAPAWAATPRPKTAPKAAKPEPQMVTGRGTTYIEMEGSELRGQSNKSGAVYLLQRADLPEKSMVRQRTSFRDQTVREVLVP